MISFDATIKVKGFSNAEFFASALFQRAPGRNVPFEVDAAFLQSIETARAFSENNPAAVIPPAAVRP